MISLNFVLVEIVTLFLIFVVFRSMFSLKICALCVSVFITWLNLLFLFYLGWTISPTLIGILMGGSMVGLIYLLESKFSEDYLIFKLPFFLALVSIAYFVLEKIVKSKEIFILIAIWLVSLVIYKNRNSANFRLLGRRMIECCKNW